MKLAELFFRPFRCAHCLRWKPVEGAYAMGWRWRGPDSGFKTIGWCCRECAWRGAW